MKKSLLAIAFAMIALCSCDSGDSLTDIFLSHPWKVSFFKEGTMITSPSQKAVYTMNFYDKTFALTTPSGATLAGYWQADNKERTFRCSQVRVTGGTIAGDTIAMKAEYILKNARYYEGDANWLQIIVQTGNVFMQFHNK
jgi:hypothetical protein